MGRSRSLPRRFGPGALAACLALALASACVGPAASPTPIPTPNPTGSPTAPSSPSPSPSPTPARRDEPGTRTPRPSPSRPSESLRPLPTDTPVAGQSLTAIHRVGPKLGLAIISDPAAARAGGTGLLLRITADAGRTWSEPHPLPVELVPLGLQFADERNGWMLDRESFHSVVLRHTTDGGRTWQKVVVDADNRAGYEEGIQPIDARRATLYVHGDGIDVDPCLRYDTADGGRTWKKTRGDYCFESPRFAGSAFGYTYWRDGPTESAASLLLYTTTNGGATWTRGRVLGAPAGLRLMNLWLVERVPDGSMRALMSAIGAEPHHSLVLVSRDEGATWAIDGYLPEDVWWVASLGEAGAWFGMRPGSNATVTTDAGKTWHPRPIPIKHETPTFEFVTPLDGWRIENRLDSAPGCSWSSGLMATRDGGLTWRAILSTPGFDQPCPTPTPRPTGT